VLDLSLIAAAFFLGLAFNAAPGPVFAETVRRGVGGGFGPALGVQLGSLAGDALWAVIGLAGIGFLSQGRWVRVAATVVGAGYLIWLAWESWWEGLRGGLPAEADPGVLKRRAFRSGVLLSLTNPQNVAYWAALGSAVAAVGVEYPVPADYAAFFVGFMLSSLVWALLFAALVDRFLGRVGAGWYRVTHRLCAVLFFALALAALVETLSGAGV
jgi:chemosensory pili system protein ChpE/L-lysine exporter family protein LysE/ArgO